MAFRGYRHWRILLTASFMAALVKMSVFAAGSGLELSPPAVDLQMEPGSTRTFDVMIGNKSDSAGVRLKAWLAPITQSRNGKYELAEKEDKWSALPWLELKTENLSLGPKGQRLVTVKVKMPRGAAGTRAAAIVFDNVTDQPNNKLDSIGGALTFVNRLTTIVKITAKNRSNRLDAALSQMAVLYPLDQRVGNFGPNALAVVCVLANEGDTVFNGQGRLIIRNSEGRRIKEGPLGMGRGTVLPGASVEFVSIFPEGLPEGKYAAEVTIAYGASRPLQGKIPFEIAKGRSTAGSAETAKGIRLLVTPELFQTALSAGAFRGLTLNLGNQESTPVHVKISLRGLAMNPNGGFMAAEEKTGPWSAVSWAKLNQENLTLAAGEKKNITITVNVPKGTVDGTRYALLCCEATRSGTDKAAAATEIITPLAVNVGKNLVKKAAITRTWLEQPDQQSPFQVCATLTNQGNTHLTLHGNLVLSKRTEAPRTEGGVEYLGEGKYEAVDTIPLGELPDWILPGGAQSVAIPYPKALAPGAYQLELSIDYGGELPVKGAVRFEISAK